MPALSPAEEGLLPESLCSPTSPAHTRQAPIGQDLQFCVCVRTCGQVSTPACGIPRSKASAVLSRSPPYLFFKICFTLNCVSAVGVCTRVQVPPESRGIRFPWGWSCGRCLKWVPKLGSSGRAALPLTADWSYILLPLSGLSSHTLLF